MLTLSDEWLHKPFHVQMLEGLARDRGHDIYPAYADDGVLQIRCKRCSAMLVVDNKDSAWERRIIDIPCLPVLVPHDSSCRYLRPGKNYQMRDVSRPDWDWVYLQCVEWDGHRFVAIYIPNGGHGEQTFEPATDFHTGGTMYEDIQEGSFACQVCGRPSASAGGGLAHCYCVEHWPVELAGYYRPIMINTYQANRLLAALEQHPELNTGDWWGELQILLRNQGYPRSG